MDNHDCDITPVIEPVKEKIGMPRKEQMSATPGPELRHQIRWLREGRLKMTQAQLAARLHCSQSLIAAWEKGDDTRQPDTADLLALGTLAMEAKADPWIFWSHIRTIDRAKLEAGFVPKDERKLALDVSIALEVLDRIKEVELDKLAPFDALTFLKQLRQLADREK